MRKKLTGVEDICEDGVTPDEVSQMLNLGNSVVSKVTYENDKLTSLIVENNGYTCEFKDTDEPICEKGVSSEDKQVVIEFKPNGTTEDKKWSQNPFDIDIVVDKGDGHDIVDTKICVQNSECTPSDNYDGKSISVTEEGKNVICIETTNAIGKTKKVCSDPMGIDRTKPEAGTISIDKAEGENGWYTDAVTITPVAGSDPISGHKSTTVDITSITENTTGTKVTVTTTDNAGNTSTREYIIKIDKDAPVFSGISDITVNKGETVDLSQGITVEDTVSGLNGAYTYSPTTVDTSKAGITNVTYTAKDLAGNTTTVVRTIVVDAEKPSINYVVNSGIINSNGWAKEAFYVNATITDNSGLNIKEAKWCLSANGECTPTTPLTENTLNTYIQVESNNNRICIEATDNNNKTNTVCSDVYKLDLTAPVFNGISDITVNKGETVSLISGVTVDETGSGMSGTYTYNPTTVDTSKAGITNVTYTATDLAGNTTTVVRKVIVDADGPSIDYAVNSGIINSNGWAKEKFYVNATITDNSGLGIKEAKWCLSENGDCTPSATVSGNTLNTYIQTESNNNRICITATDNNNKTSNICSDTYKLDLTAPQINSNNIVVSGTMGSNSWYTTNLTISKTDPTDLSGIASSTLSASSITANTASQTITLTVTDKAGHTSTATKTVKVDKNAPTVTAKATSNKVTKGATTDPKTFFNVTYSTSSGSMSCNYSSLSGLAVGTYTLTCTATGGNGKTANASTTIVVEEAYYCSTGTLVNDSSKGYICTTSASTSRDSYDCNCEYYDCRCTTYDCNCTTTQCNCRMEFDAALRQECYDMCDAQPDADEFCKDGCPEYSRVCDTCKTCDTCERCSTCESCDTCYSTSYYCPSGWSTYSGSGSSLKCYKAADKK